MINMLDKGHIIKLVDSGLSYREVGRRTGVHRKTVAKYHKEHKERLSQITRGNQETGFKITWGILTP